MSNRNKFAKRDEIVHAFNPSIREDETGGLQVQGQSELHSETLSEKNRRKQKRRHQLEIQKLRGMEFRIILIPILKKHNEELYQRKPQIESNRNSERIG
jgi:hypothetical protein